MRIGGGTFWRQLLVDWIVDNAEDKILLDTE